eukprot:2013032-Alexandrium_andersonii.AAC.1
MAPTLARVGASARARRGATMGGAPHLRCSGGRGEARACPPAGRGASSPLWSSCLSCASRW